MKEAEQPTIGIIGMGDMGRMYAKRLSAGGIKKIYVCDRPETYDALKAEFEGTGVTPLQDGHAVSRLSTFIIYSVEAAVLASVVAQYGPSTRLGAVVAGQTSVKAPEKEAFEKWLPKDVGITSVHSLHGPSVTTEGQPLIIIHHRGPKENVAMVEEVFRSFKSRYVYLSYEQHDQVTANTQAVTHAAFLSMGTAWHKSSSYPWETTRYVSGIEVIKVNITLRIYSAKWHVYAGLALLNPSAQSQIHQYATSTTELFKLMIEGRGLELEERIWKAREEVFGWRAGQEAPSDERKPILLSEHVLDQFSLGKAQGVAEYLFRSPSLLTSALRAALKDTVHRPDDVEFVIAARGWSECVDVGNFEWYQRRFEETADFFAPRFEEATKLGGKMIKAIQNGMKGRD
nr:prephenate dehydrogenase (NADP+) [Cryptococcus depauperatus CBS 7855]